MIRSPSGRLAIVQLVRMLPLGIAVATLTGCGYPGQPSAARGGGSTNLQVMTRLPIQLVASTGSMVGTTVMVKNDGTATVKYKALGSADWLRVVEGTGGTIPGGTLLNIGAQTTCPDLPATYSSGIDVTTADSTITVPITLACSTATTTIPKRLQWPPPALTNPTTIHVNPTQDTALNLDPTKDYVISMPQVPVQYGVSINGGHNIVMIGGEISIPWQGTNPSIASRRALKIQGATGIVHIEGVLMDGPDISEGINIAAPDAIVQVENVRIENIHARDEVNFTDNHPDLIQTWGGVGDLRVDHFSGSTDYQAFMLKSDFGAPHGPVTMENVSVVGEPTARYLLWFADNGTGPTSLTLSSFYLAVPPQRVGGLSKAVWPDVDQPDPAVISTQGTYTVATWPSLPIAGEAIDGTPRSGDFVPAGVAGIGYVSPGYQ